MQQNEISEESLKSMSDKRRLIDERPIQPSSQMNGIYHHRNSSSDYHQNYHSSSSQEVESAELHLHNQKLLFSALPSETSSSTFNPTESSGESSNDSVKTNTLEVQISPLKTAGHPSLYLEENMFRARRLETDPTPKHANYLLKACGWVDGLKIPLYLLNYKRSLEQIEVNSDSSDCAKSLDDEKIDSQHFSSSEQEDMNFSQNKMSKEADKQPIAGKKVHLNAEQVCAMRCRVATSKKLKNLTASINASTSKGKNDRKIMLTTVNVPPCKRQKTDFSKCNGKNGNSTVTVPPKVIAPVPPKSTSNHIKPEPKKSKKDAPLMQKAKKAMGELYRIRRS